MDIKYEHDDKMEMAVDMADHLDARRGYSGALKRWYVNKEDLSWRIRYHQTHENVEVNVTPRPVPVKDDMEVSYVTNDPPDFEPRHNEELPGVTYKNAEQFVGEIREIARDHFGIEEAIIREAVRKEIRQLL